MASENKKTIFLTVIRADIVKNLLFNDFFKFLAEKYRIVILTPLFNDPEFKNKFGQFAIAPLHLKVFSPFKQKMEKFFVALNKALIYNPTIDLRSRYGLMLRSRSRFKGLKVFFQKQILGRFFSRPTCRNLVKKIDRWFLTPKIYDELIKEHRPDLVFVTSVGSDEEIALLRNCKKFGVKSVAMAKSWDNASKFGFREKADKAIVWSEYMKEEFLRFQDYSARDIKVVGVPQFDYYQNLPLPGREEFFQQWGLDLNRKTIFFGSEGPVCPDDPYVVKVLKKAIESGQLSNCQVIIRPHFSYKNDRERFLPLVDKKLVFIEDQPATSAFKDGTELSLAGAISLAAQIKYGDIHITSASTLVLDIIAGGHYPILYNFDQDKNAPFKDSVKRLYGALWFKEIFKMGLDNLANSGEELIEKIKLVLASPNFKMGERQAVVARFCHQLDGQSGRRLFNFIDEYLLGGGPQTIFITISQAILVRNILRSEVLARLKDNYQVVVYLTGEEIPQYLKDEFNHPNVKLLPLPEDRFKASRLYRRFTKFNSYLLLNKTTKRSFIYSRHYLNKSKLTCYGHLFLLHFLSRLPLIKKLSRFLEEKVFYENSLLVKEQFDHYWPALVFATSITSKIDRIFIKEAKRRQIKTLAMTKSWDIATRTFLSLLPDYFVVQNEILKQELIKNQGFRSAEKIFVTGFPQFDWYAKPELIRTKAEHFQKMGLDPDRHLIFFGSSGRWSLQDYQVAEQIHQWILNNELILPCQLIIRPHFTNVKDSPLRQFKGKEKVVYDESFNISQFFSDNWDPTLPETVDFVNTLKHSAVVINVFSTLALDAACLDRPIINVLFGSMYRGGQDVTMIPAEHYQWVIDTDGTTIVKSAAELKKAINDYLLDQQIKNQGREKIRKNLCYQVDGRCSQRLVAAIDKILI